MTIALTILAVMVFKRREIQPLKLKSPQLLTLFLVGNVLTVVFLALIQLNVELELCPVSQV